MHGATCSRGVPTPPTHAVPLCTGSAHSPSGQPPPPPPPRIAREPAGCTTAVVRRPTAGPGTLHIGTRHPAHARRWRGVGAASARYWRSTCARSGAASAAASAALRRSGSTPQQCFARGDRPGLFPGSRPAQQLHRDWAHPLTHVRRIGCVRCRGMHRIRSDRGWAGLGCAGLGWAGQRRLG